MAFAVQLKHNVRARFLVKLRQRKQTIMEVVYPLYMALILVVINLAIRPATLPAVPSFPTVASTDPAPLSCLFRDSDFTCTSAGIFVTGANRILYSPNSSDVTSIMNAMKSSLSTATSSAISPTLQGYANEADLLDAYTASSDSVLSAVVFDGASTSVGTTSSIKIRYNPTYAPNTDNKKANLDACRPKYKAYSGSQPSDPYSDASSKGLPTQCAALEYISNWMAPLQLALVDALASHNGQTTNLLGGVKLSELPTPELDRGFVTMNVGLQSVFAVYMVMGLQPIVQYLLQFLVSEKEKGIKQGMVMMGLRESVFWSSWLVVYSAMTLVTSLIIVILFKASGLTSAASFIVLLLVFFLFCLTLIGIAFIISVFFSKAKTAATVGSLLVIALGWLYLPLQALNLGSGPRMALSLLSPVAFSQTMSTVFSLESGAGATFSTINERIDSYSVADGLGMMFFDVLFYLFLAWYLDNIIPQSGGVHRHPLFLFKASFWSKEAAIESARRSSMSRRELKPRGDNVDVEDDEDIAHRAEVTVRGLRKVFREHAFRDSPDDKVAVDDLDLNLCEGEIFALLGHNGAGKSTAIAMLTGALDPTAGEATMYGVSLRGSVERVRQMLGVCPQQDVLFDQLTVREHARLYAAIKGVPIREVESAAASMLQRVGLEDKIDTMAAKLSGGQKRKLGVAIALLGSPRIVFLDEPTTGLDPVSRRRIWKVLREEKQNKTIVLTTHFMDEADLLADRKAILVQGRVRCAGSSLFLKRRFGLGYEIKCEVDNAAAQVDRVLRSVRSSCGDAAAEAAVSGTVRIHIPDSASAALPAVLRTLETSRELGVKSVGVEMTTLEQVFMRFSEEKSEEEGAEGDGKEAAPSSTSSILPPPPQGPAQNLSQIAAVVRARWKQTRAQKAALVFTFMLPIILIIVSMLVSRSAVSSSGSQPDVPLVPAAIADSATGSRVPFALDGTAATASSPAAVAAFLGSAQGSPSVYCFNSPTAVPSSCGDAAAFASAVFTARSDGADPLAPAAGGIVVRDISGGGAAYAADVFFRDNTIHAIPAYLNAFASAAYASAVAGGSVQMSLFPLPSTSTDRAFEFDSGIIIYGVALVFVAGALAGTLVLDREAGVRHLLYMGGLRVPVYYIGTLTHDMACYYVSAILSVILAAAFGTQPIGGNGVGIFILLLIEFVPAMTLFAYLLSFLFSKAETAYRIVPNMLVFLSILPNIAVQIVLSQSESTAKIIHSVLSVLSPSYGLVGSMTFMNYHYALEKVETGHPPTESSYFSTIVMFNIIVFAAQIVVLAWLLYVIEKYRYARAEDGNASSSMKLRDCCDNHSAAIEPARDDAAGSAEAADSDVEEAAADAARHVRQLASGERLPTVSIATHDLYKEFRLPDRSIKRAVDEVSFEVKAGEAFALLGPNGAGKTTTIRILTGEERATRGEGFIAGHNIRTNLLDAFTSTGLCPQRNALWENLSVYEHLLLFARVRGYPGPRQRAVATPSDHLKDDLLESGIGTADQVADRMIRLFGIEEYRNKLVRQLSGGTKRKLSAAIALCSVPPVVFMDEPSSGMDVKTRRGMWDCLADLVRSRCAVLTTHSLEEAEALCSVVGIMINGRMRCIGTPQHLKNKFGGGWRLEVKCNPGDDGERAAHDLVVQVSPQAELEESIFGRRVYTLPRESKQAAHELFAFFEEARSAGKIRDYALGQSSLEQVFLRLANEQVDEAHP